MRSLSGGFGALDGIMFTHEIIFELQDATAGHVIGSYTMTDVNVLCGGLVWPIAPAACNSAASDTYPAKFNLYTAGGSGQIVNGHAYREIVMVATVIQGEGVGFGLEATTTASSISGSLSW
ncbi:MAG TPA: hypothetical protein VKR24_05420 [Candidatus Limnocylindrales bacterium]|nr:hypothetical protein [Candidatus Limnocylindrales bacterium]